MKVFIAGWADLIDYPDDKGKFTNGGMLVVDGVMGLVSEYDDSGGQYSGLVEYTHVAYQEYLTGSQLIRLAGLTAYGAIVAASQAGDAAAVYFVDIGRELNKEGAKIWVEHTDYIAAIAHFLDSAYIDQAKNDEMLLGVLVE